MPWPISTCGMISVTAPWLSMRMKAFGANAGFWAGAPNAKGRLKATTQLPPTATPACRNPRRVRAVPAAESSGKALCLRSIFDRRTDAHVSAAPANVARHGRIDVGIFGMRSGVEQSRCRHDLARLAVAALDHLQLEPCLLHFGPRAGRADALDGGDCALADRAHGQEAGAHRRTVHMHGAGTALRYPASELGAGEPQDIAQYPEKRHIGGSIDIF